VWAVNFDTYRNLQRHRTVLPARARHLVLHKLLNSLLQRTLSLLSARSDVRDQDAHDLNRFVVIKYVDSEGKFVYSARRHDNIASSCICQLQQHRGLLKVQTLLNPLGTGNCMKRIRHIVY